DAGASAAWLRKDYWDAVNRRAEDLPRYLLLLGDPHLVSWDLQQLLGADAFAGRLAFGADSGYEAYVEKVLAWEQRPPAPAARLLFHTVRDGTMSTVVGYRELMSPSLAMARELRERRKLSASDICEIASGPPPGPASSPPAHEVLRQ